VLVVEGVRSDVPFVVAVAVSRSRGRVTERVYRALVSSLLHSMDYSLARSLHPTLTPLASPLRLRTTSIVITPKPFSLACATSHPVRCFQNVISSLVRCSKVSPRDLVSNPNARYSALREALAEALNYSVPHIVTREYV
jgi:hypothetical protein